MKKRNYKFYIRKSHRYLGVFIGIQFVLWTAGGLYFSWTNINEIRGDQLRNEHEKSIDIGQPLISPQSAIEAMISSGQASSIGSIRVVNILGNPHYEIGYRRTDGKEEFALVDAVTGKPREQLTEYEAKQIALQSLKINQPIRNVVYLTKENVGAHHEYRDKPLPAWAVTFDNSDGLTVYVSAQTGQIGAFRTGDWRIFDFLWMLHTMDYNERDNINNWVLRSISVLGIVTLFSGFVLFFASSRFWRNRFVRRPSHHS